MTLLGSHWIWWFSPKSTRKGLWYFHLSDSKIKMTQCKSKWPSKGIKMTRCSRQNTNINKNRGRRRDAKEGPRLKEKHHRDQGARGQGAPVFSPLFWPRNSIYLQPNICGMVVYVFHRRLNGSLLWMFLIIDVFHRRLVIVWLVCYYQLWMDLMVFYIMSLHELLSVVNTKLVPRYQGIWIGQVLLIFFDKFG